MTVAAPADDAVEQAVTHTTTQLRSHCSGVMRRLRESRRAGDDECRTAAGAVEMAGSEGGPR